MRPETAYQYSRGGDHDVGGLEGGVEEEVGGASRGRPHVVAVAPQVDEVRQRLLGQADPPLLDIRGQLLGGASGEQLGVAVGAAAAEDEQKAARHEIPQMNGEVQETA